MSVSKLYFETSYKTLVDSFSKPVAVFDDAYRLVYSNDQFTGMFGSSAQCIGELLATDAGQDLKALTAELSLAGEAKGQFKIPQNISAVHTVKFIRLQSKSNLRYAAVIEVEIPSNLSVDVLGHQYDDLTKLPNRYAFLSSLQHKIESSVNNPLKRADFAVLYIDLDHFKDINELHGHEVGDKLLKTCAEKIRQMLRGDDLLARLSGDDFGVIVDCEESYELTYLCHRLLRYFERPIVLKEQRYQFSVSIGIAFFPDQGDSPQTLIINAEKAMFEAKKSGRAQFHLYDRKESQKIERQQRIAETMRDILTNQPNQFYANFQPLYELESGRFVGVEVLARWLSPEFGQVSPVDFIPLAESRGLINSLTSSIFTSVRKNMLSTPPNSGDKKPLLAINVSAPQIGDPVFEKLLTEFYSEVERAGWQLELEITESQLMTLNDDLINQLKAWREKGMRIAIDDFGTGYSCLAYLHLLPVDKLKIDRQFLQAQTQTHKEDEILIAILSMAKALDIEVLTEGIETKRQLNRLKVLGCYAGQGFGLAKPQAWKPELMSALNLS